MHANDGGSRRKQYLSRLIVGADGASSVIARQAGMEMRDPRHVSSRYAPTAAGCPQHAILLLRRGIFPGYGWVFPINESLANIGVGMVKESLQRDSLRLRRFYPRLVRSFEDWLRDAGTEIELTRPAGWPIKTYGGASRNYFDRGLLIGDAGCFVDPISGEGIPLALQSAKLAAETIRTAFAAGQFGSEVMARFEVRWRREFDADLSLADLVVTAIRNRRLVKLWTHSLRVIALTASQDRGYAQKVGGILAGLVPCRAGLSADVVLKSLLHGPQFWLERSRCRTARPPPGAGRGEPDRRCDRCSLARRGASLVPRLGGGGSAPSSSTLRAVSDDRYSFTRLRRAARLANPWRTNVKQWLEGAGLGQYADVFADNDIDLDVMFELTSRICRTSGYRSATAEAFARDQGRR